MKNSFHSLFIICGALIFVAVTGLAHAQTTDLKTDINDAKSLDAPLVHTEAAAEDGEISQEDKSAVASEDSSDSTPEEVAPEVAPETSASHTNTNEPISDPQNYDLPVESTAPISPRRSWLALGLRLGGGLHEKAVVRNKFDGSLAIGPQIELRFFKLKSFQFAFNVGFLHFSHKVNKGTDAIHVQTKYNRIDTALDVEFVKNSFFVNSKAGVGFMIISTESTLIQNDVMDKSVYNGVDVGFLAGLGIGFELGTHWLKLSREVDFSVQMDWMRRGERDEFFVGALINVALFRN